MSSELTHQEQRKRQRNDVDADLQRQLETPAPDFSGLEEGQLSGDRATGLQAHLGNQTILNLLDNLDRNAANLDALENEEEQEEGQEVELEREPSLEADTEFRQLGGGGGGGGGGNPSDNPWDIGVMFGGEDDPEPVNRPKRRRRKRRRQNPDAIEDVFEEDEEFVPAAASDAIVDVFATPDDAHTVRWGDSVLTAVEPALLDPDNLDGRTLDLAHLEAHAGRQDPLHRPTAIGRFLAEGRGGLAFADVLSGPAGGLLPEQGGFPGAVARLATLTICAEQEAGGDVRTDRACALAMCAQVWPLVLDVARSAARQGKLHAPFIAASALGQKTLPEESRRVLPPPSLLGGRALEAALPLGHIPHVPNLHIPQAPQFHGDVDEALSTVDAVLARFTGGDDPAALPSLPMLTHEMIAPLLAAANQLMNALGRAQVELAAAAVAVRTVRGEAPIRSTLNTADTALRQLARGVVQAAQRLEKMRGAHLLSVQTSAEQAAAVLQSSKEALDALRTWGMATLAGAMDAQLQPRGAR